MLIVSQLGEQAFSAGLMESFVERCLAMVAENFPDRCAMSSRSMVCDQIHRAIECAAMAGFDAEPEAIQFVYLHFLLGSGFSADPQYGWLRGLLTGRNSSPEARMDAAMDAIANRMNAGQPLENSLTSEERSAIAAVVAANP